MHCCRLSHPWVYKVGKMSSTLNVHGGGMQRWCSSNNTDREHLNARRVRLYLWYLLISTIFSYYTLPPLNLQAHFFGAIVSVLLKFRENPFTEMRRKKNGGMPGCLSVFLLRLWKCFWHPGTMQSDCGVSTQTSRVWPVWSYLTWNTREGEALVWTFTWKRK